jgi:signal transduction histidine kinase
VLIALVLGALTLLYDDVLSNLVSSLAKTVSEGRIPSPTDNAFAAQDLEIAKQQNMVLASTGVLILAAIFGYLITRLALTPTRDALTNQKQFVGNIAHELRTPLSIIKTNTEVALFNEKLDADTREMLVSNVEELDRISDIINNLLSMNMLLRPGKMEFQNVDLAAIIERVRSALEDLAGQKDITVEIRLSEWRTVWGNPSGVEQIIMNVAKNALNYTQRGGKVSISVEPSDNKHIGITVEDNGAGINEEDLAKIFEPFYRGDRSRNRGSGGGTGLGLAIVSELVKLHKGRISIRSAIGKGTVVSIYLPEGQATTTNNSKDGERSEVAMDFTA